MENQVTVEEALRQASLITISRGNPHLLTEFLESVGLSDEQMRDLILRDTDDFIHNFPEIVDYPLGIAFPSYGIHWFLAGAIWGSNHPNAITVEKER